VFVHSPTEDVVFVKTDDAWMLESSMAKQPISTEKSAAKKTDRVVNQMLITVLQPLKKVAPQAIDLGQMYDAFVKDDEAGKALMDVLQYLRYGKFIELSDEQVRLTHTGRSYLRDLKRAELAANRSSASA
jgi:predicted methyltransferase